MRYLSVLGIFTKISSLKLMIDCNPDLKTFNA